jgi:hypothetical protein
VVVDVGFTVIAAVVAVVFHTYVPPPLAVKVVLVPLHIVTSNPAFANGNGVTVTTTASVAEQPDALTITLYVVVAPGVTVMLDVVAVVFQRYEPIPVAVKVVDVPAQIVTSNPAFAAGMGLTVTTTLSVAVQPFNVTVTV